MKKTVIFFSVFFIIAILISFVLLLVVSDSPKDVHLSNLTDRSATISWTSRRKTPGSVLLKEGDSTALITLNSDGYSKFPDDRDLSNKILTLGNNENVNPQIIESTTVEDSERADFYTHYVTVKDLSPNTTYSFMLGNDLVYFRSSSIELKNNSFTTLNEPDDETISVPDPAYGLVYQSESEMNPVPEGIIYMRITDEGTNESSTLISTTIGDDGSWYIDLGKAKSTSTGDMFLEGRNRESTQIYHQTDIVLDHDDSFSLQIPINEDAPAKDIFADKLLTSSTWQEEVDILLAQASSMLEVQPVGELDQNQLIFQTDAICCESITCNDGTTFGRDVHTPHASCDARAAEGCRNHGGVQSQDGACDTSDVPTASNFCLQYCGIDSNRDGKLANYEANFDLRGQWCECCNQNCGGGFGCESDPRFQRQCGGSASRPGSTPQPSPAPTPGGPSGPGSTPTPGGPSGPSGPSGPGETPSPAPAPTPGSGDTPTPGTPPSSSDGSLPLMVRWFNYRPEMGPAYVYAMTHASQHSGIGSLQGDVIKMMMSFNFGELSSFVGNAEQLRGWGITQIGYNTEGNHTPGNEISSMNSCDPNSNYVAKAAKLATDAGFDFVWGPIRVEVDNKSDCAIQTMISAGMRGLAMQEQKFIESQQASSRLSAVKSTIDRYNSIAASVGVSDMQYHVQIMESRCPDLNNCVQFVQGLDDLGVTSVAIWSNGNISQSFVNAIKGGGTGGGGTYNIQESSPYGIGGGGDLDISSSVNCTYQGMSYEQGSSYAPAGNPDLYCFNGKMHELEYIVEDEKCSGSDYCYCVSSERVIGSDDSDRYCDNEELSSQTVLDQSGQCKTSNACNNRSPGFSSCIDIGREQMELTCSNTCQESWDPCDGTNVVQASPVTNLNSQKVEFERSLWEQLLNKVSAQGEDSTSQEILISPENGLLHFPSPGKYCMTYENDDYCFKITAKRNNLVFIDKDGDGKYTANEDINLGLNATVLKVMVEEVEHVYTIKQGQNFISFNHVPVGQKLTAAGMLEQINSEEGTVILSIAKYDSGQWKLVGERDGQIYKSEDFLIIPGQGYLIRATKDIEYTMTGGAILEPVPIHFDKGWNLISLNGFNETGYTAESMIDSIDQETNMDAVNVTQWDNENMTFEGLQKQEDEDGEMQVYGFDFPILNYQGYFVKINSGEGEWVPKD